MGAFELFSDVSYGTHERHKFDIFIPEEVKNKSGAILFIHGGGWHDGDKSIHHKDCQYFCNLGYISATMNYRFVTDELTVFDELDDITCALEGVKEFLSGRGFDISNILLSGGSAGGHLSSLYAYTRKNEAPVTPVAVCVYCPPVDFSRSEFLEGISDEFEEWKFGLISNCCGIKVTKATLMNEPQQSALKKISPVKYVTGECVPTAVFQGVHDDLVPFSDAQRFIGLLNECKVKNDFVVYGNSGHALDKDPEASQMAKDIIADYLKKYL